MLQAFVCSEHVTARKLVCNPPLFYYPPLACIACKVFDILYLKDGPEIVVLERMIDELTNFGFVQYNNEEFINSCR